MPLVISKSNVANFGKKIVQGHRKVSDLGFIFKGFYLYNMHDKYEVSISYHGSKVTVKVNIYITQTNRHRMHMNKNCQKKTQFASGNQI